LQGFARVNASQTAPVLMLSQIAQISRAFQGMILMLQNCANCTL